MAAESWDTARGSAAASALLLLLTPGKGVRNQIGSEDEAGITPQ